MDEDGDGFLTVANSLLASEHKVSVLYTGKVSIECHMSHNTHKTYGSIREIVPIIFPPVIFPIGDFRNTSNKGWVSCRLTLI
jgi:hypothetical protein